MCHWCQCQPSPSTHRFVQCTHSCSVLHGGAVAVAGGGCAPVMLMGAIGAQAAVAL